MNEIAAWLAGKGLTISAEAMRRVLELPDRDSLGAELHDVSTKLDALIQAPFREAVFYLREGDLDRCRDRLVAAMATDQLNLAAKILYCDLMRFTGRHAVALDHYWEIAAMFGPRADVIPAELARAYAAQPFFRRPESDLVLSHEDDFYPRAVAMSRRGLGVVWEFRENVLWKVVRKALAWPVEVLTVHDWDSTIRTVPGRDIRILAITDRYLVSTVSGRIRVDGLDGTLVQSNLPDAARRALWTDDSDDDPLQLRRGWLSTTEPIAFGDITVTSGVTAHSRTETSSYMYHGQRMTSKNTITTRHGVLRIKVAPPG